LFPPALACGDFTERVVLSAPHDLFDQSVIVGARFSWGGEGL